MNTNNKFNYLANTNIANLTNLITDTADLTDIQIKTVEELQQIDINISLRETRENIERITFGIDSLDILFGEYEYCIEQQSAILKPGFCMQDIILLCGMSGTGKTTCAMNLFAKLYKKKIRTCFLSLDMREDRTWDFFRNALVGFNSSGEDFIDQLAIFGKPNIISSKSVKFEDVTIFRIDDYLTKLSQTYMLPQVIFIDYIDMIRPTQKKMLPKEHFKYLFLELKALAQKHNCSFVILSQSTEDKGYRQGRPTLSNVYGGKEVRSAVDHVIAVYRNYNYNEKLPIDFRNISEIIGLKLRSNASERTAYVRFNNGIMENISYLEICSYRTAISNSNK